MLSRLLLASAITALATPAFGQSHEHNVKPAVPAPTSAPAPAPAPAEPVVDHSAMDHASMDHGSAKQGAMDHSQMDHASIKNAGEGSGTARLPNKETRSHGAMVGLGEDASLMLHGFVWPVYTSQTGSRGDDKFYVQIMTMATVTAPFEGGKFTARTMLSLEPAMRADG